MPFSLPSLRRITATARALWLGLGLSIVAIAPAAASSITIVRSDDNDGYWREIEQRLQSADVSYQTLDWDDIREANDLDSDDIVFLPNLEDVSRRQAAALELWLARGGRAIVSGAFADDASRRVREELRTLIGMQWLDELPSPAAMRLLSTNCDRDPACRTAWMPADALDRIPEGGILSLSGADSQAAAAWQMAGSATAVGVSPQITFLAWEWGSDDRNLEADVAWLKAAVRRSEELSPRDITAGDTPSTGMASEPPIDWAQPLDRDRPIVITDTTADPDTPPTRPAPIRTEPNDRPSARPQPRPPTSPQASQRPFIAVQPTQTGDNLTGLRVAPAGLNVERGNARISRIEALKMQRELAELIGRVQSATRTAQAIGGLDAARIAREAETDELLVAALPESPIALAATDDALDRARATLEAFPGLVDAGNYSEARDRWLDARASLLDSYPDNTQRAQPEIRAIWLDRGTIVEAGSRAGLERLFDRFEAMGITIVYFETINAGYPVYPSIITRQNPLTRGWDPLEAAVDLAKEREMELHAWVWAFAVGNQRHNEIVGDPVDYPGPVLDNNPDWANRDDRERVRHQSSRKTFLDPANPSARWHVIRHLDEIVNNYDVDGIQLDYIRYPFQDPGAERTYGYGTAAREQFIEQTGVDPLDISPSDRELWAQWTQFRVDSVTTFVREVREWIDTRRDGLTLSTAVFAYSTHERIHKLQQHWEAWIAEGIVDQVVLMSYAQDTNRLQSLVTPLVSEPSGIPIVPSIRLHDLEQSNVTDQIQAIRDLPTIGYSLFAAAALSPEVERMLQQTQGEASRLLPERAPFEMARDRYRLLIEEWDNMVQSGELWIDDEAMLQWRGRTLMLSEALDLLVESPTAENLALVRSVLTDYRAEFGGWLSLQGLSDRYQLQTWENRLTTMAILLDYGERLGFVR
ncbi:MAG: family 10 glycosylhydrolase [Geitlerinemataceae cyanobacterium]